MDTKQPDKKRGGYAVVVVVVVVFVLLPVLYVASIGPMSWLASHHLISKDVGWLYAPVGWACSKSDIIDATVRAYVTWWRK